MAAELREQLGRALRDSWVRNVKARIPHPKPSWIKPWDELNPDDPDEAFQIETDMAMAEDVIRAAYPWITSLAEMERRIEDLRAFEREYSARLRAYHQTCIGQLDGRERIPGVGGTG